MSKKINVRLLRTYFKGVLGRTEHHAGNVDEVIYYLLGAVMQFGSDEIEVRTYKDNVANEIWFNINQQKYCMVYDHEKECVVLKRNTHDKTFEVVFNNDNSLQEVLKTFKTL